MYGQYGVGVYQQLVLSVYRFLDLLLRAVLLAQETGTLGQCLLVDLGARRHDARGVPLHLHGRCSHHQFAGLHVAQILVALAGIVPLLELAVKESHQWRVVDELLFALIHLLACHNL